MEASNNVAKLRELAEFVAHIDDNGYTSHDVQCAIDKARAAIAAPARNCDVGTAEEQTIRFNKFCLDNRTENDFGCGDCKCNSEDSKKCEFLWAQMPYEEGGAK